ncbi:type I restriction-modification system S subunit [Streptococcus pneumoniae]|nr:type I restriction-modification system S subunit [Streptococcus pneumoniae]
MVDNKNKERTPIKENDRSDIQGEYPYYGATGIVDFINDYKYDGEYLLIAEDGKNLLTRKKPVAFRASGKFWVNNHAHVVSYNGMCNLIFLEYYLESLNLEPYVTGIDQFKLNKSNLDRIPVTCPPIKLQEKFADFIKEIDLQRLKQERHLHLLEKNFSSLLHGAFKGELSIKTAAVTK